MKFQTAKSYTDRQSKAAYVHDKFRTILTGSVLDVGADQCYLKDLLPPGARYVGVGMGGSPDIEVDLEKQILPFADNEFDCVLCLDVLEHLDNTHKTFDELCRVSRRHVIISLPNSYRDFLGMMFGRAQDRAVNFKYYGLPVDRPMDRHKWFFSNSDAESYVRGRAAANGMSIVQIDSEGSGPPKTFTSFAKRAVLKGASLVMAVKASDLYHKTLWAVLEKPQPPVS